MFLVVSFWMKIIRCYYHPILDVSCRQFSDENYMLLLSSNIGCLLSSVFGVGGGGEDLVEIELLVS